jgi:hypothetical protein
MKWISDRSVPYEGPRSERGLHSRRKLNPTAKKIPAINQPVPRYFRAKPKIVTLMAQLKPMMQPLLSATVDSVVI